MTLTEDNANRLSWALGRVEQALVYVRATGAGREQVEAAAHCREAIEDIEAVLAAEGPDIETGQ